MEEKGINFKTIPNKTLKVLTSPASFFQEMPKTGGFIEPMVFMIVMGVISGLIHALFSMLGLNSAAGAAMGAAAIVITPIMTAIFGFVGAAIIFIIWKLMGSQQSYETAYRCGAYLAALAPVTAITGFIPYLGPVLGILLFTIFIVVASVEVHKISSQKAWLVFGIIGAIFTLISITGQIAARRFARDLAFQTKEMEKAAKDMQQTAEKMQKSFSSQTGQMTAEQKRQLEESMKQMENLLKQTSEMGAQPRN